VDGKVNTRYMPWLASLPLFVAETVRAIGYTASQAGCIFRSGCSDSQAFESAGMPGFRGAYEFLVTQMLNRSRYTWQSIDITY